MASRRAKIERGTKETKISISVNLDGTGKTAINTGVSFVDHMIESFAKHGLMDLCVSARSNDKIDHHLIEDTAIAIGMCIDKALGKRTGIARFGHASIPMDESLAEASVDLIKRPYHKLDMDIQRSEVEGISKEDIEHFFQSLLQNLCCCIHLSIKYGQNDHHKIESAIKSLALAFRTAAAPDRRQKMPSTKGSM